MAQLQLHKSPILCTRSRSPLYFCKSIPPPPQTPTTLPLSSTSSSSSPLFIPPPAPAFVTSPLPPKFSINENKRPTGVYIGITMKYINNDDLFHASDIITNCKINNNEGRENALNNDNSTNIADQQNCDNSCGYGVDSEGEIFVDLEKFYINNNHEKFRHPVWLLNNYLPILTKQHFKYYEKFIEMTNLINIKLFNLVNSNEQQQDQQQQQSPNICYVMDYVIRFKMLPYHHLNCENLIKQVKYVMGESLKDVTKFEISFHLTLIYKRFEIC